MNQRRSFIVLLAAALLLGAFVFSASAKGEVGAPVFQSPLPTETPTLPPPPTVTPIPLPRSASAFFKGTPVPAVVPIGTEFTFEVGLDVANIVPGVAGAEVYISYPADRVAPVASPGNPIAEVLPDFFGLSSVSVNEVTTCQSEACTHLVVAGPAQVTQYGAVARYHFRPIAAGEICFEFVSVELADADGYPVATTPLGGFCINDNPRILGKVLRQGTPANPNPGGGTLSCSLVKLSDGRTLTTDVNGEFAFEQATAGASYTIEASYSGYLKANKSFVASTGDTNLGTVYLLGGDVNGSGAINIQDIGASISEFGLTGLPVRSASVGCAGSDDPNDINDDGVVNIGDLAITANNWAKVGPMMWP